MNKDAQIPLGAWILIVVILIAGTITIGYLLSNLDPDEQKNPTFLDGQCMEICDYVDMSYEGKSKDLLSSNCYCRNKQGELKILQRHA